MDCASLQHLSGVLIYQGIFFSMHRKRFDIGHCAMTEQMTGTVLTLMYWASVFKVGHIRIWQLQHN